MSSIERSTYAGRPARRPSRCASAAASGSSLACCGGDRGVARVDDDRAREALAQEALARGDRARGGVDLLDLLALARLRDQMEGAADADLGADLGVAACEQVQRGRDRAVVRGLERQDRVRRVAALDLGQRLVRASRRCAAWRTLPYCLRAARWPKPPSWPTYTTSSGAIMRAHAESTSVMTGRTASLGKTLHALDHARDHLVVARQAEVRRRRLGLNAATALDRAGARVERIGERVLRRLRAPRAARSMSAGFRPPCRAFMMGDPRRRRQRAQRAFDRAPLV